MLFVRWFARITRSRAAFCSGDYRRTSGVADVRAVDMKIRDQCHYAIREFDYGGGKMVASSIGMPFASVKDQLEGADVVGLSINLSSGKHRDWFREICQARESAVENHCRRDRPDIQARLLPEFCDWTQPRFVWPCYFGRRRNCWPKVAATSGEQKRHSAHSWGGSCYRAWHDWRGHWAQLQFDDEPLPALDLFVNDMPLGQRRLKVMSGRKLDLDCVALHYARM